MSLFNLIYKSFYEYIEKAFNIKDKDFDMSLFSFDENTEEKRSDYGDFSSNAPMVLAKILKKNPREIAEKIVHEFKDNNIIKIEIAGVGFLNFFVSGIVYRNYINVLGKKSNTIIQKTENPICYNVEFVSANPTGPLHIGHGRGGIIGDVYSRILKKKGHSCISEFYINDAGNQIEKLGLSLFIRYNDACGIKKDFPEDGYHGEYIIEMAQNLFKQYSTTLLENTIEWFGSYAKNILLEKIKETLAGYNIQYDVWFSEKSLHDNGSIEKALKILEKNNFTHVADEGSLWLKSTDSGDDKDRVIKRSNGIYTYVAADIAYLENKIQRGAKKIIMVLGQDHHSYVVRLKSAMEALGYDPENLHVILYQLVTLKDNGELIRMSKRAGRMVTLYDILDTVGTDVARFFYINKKADTHLDFDLASALKKDITNPVYYIQYSFVRIKSVIKKYDSLTHHFENDTHEVYEFNDLEKMILRKINQLHCLLDSIIKNYHVHLVAHYMYELSSLFNVYYNTYTIVDIDKKKETQCRVQLLYLLKNVFFEVSEILGISTPDQM